MGLWRLEVCVIEWICCIECILLWNLYLHCEDKLEIDTAFKDNALII